MEVSGSCHAAAALRPRKYPTPLRTNRQEGWVGPMVSGQFGKEENLFPLEVKPVTYSLC
jgi:hypothetical protein